MTDPKTPAEMAIENLLYAPIGFVLEARHMLPTFVERGRQQVQMARLIGQFAVGQGQVEAGRRLEQAQIQARSLLAELGLPGHAAPSSHHGAHGHSAGSVGGVPPSPPAADPVPQASEASDALAIAGYDSLAASQVIPRLVGLSPAELEAVRVYESGHRARKTILGRIAQLQEG